MDSKKLEVIPEDDLNYDQHDNQKDNRLDSKTYFYEDDEPLLNKDGNQDSAFDTSYDFYEFENADKLNEPIVHQEDNQNETKELLSFDFKNTKDDGYNEPVINKVASDDLLKTDNSTKQKIESLNKKAMNAYKWSHNQMDKADVSLRKMHKMVFGDKKQDEVFELGVVISKVAVIFILAILSFVNLDVNFVKDKPFDFLKESFLVGACTAIPTIVMGRLRSRNWKEIFQMCFVLFLLFFLFNVVMEFSGINNSVHPEGLDDTKQQDVLNSSVFSNTGYAFAGVTTLSAIALAYQVGGLNNALDNKMKHFIESVSFGLSAAIPAYYINYDRSNSKSEAWSDTAKAFSLFGFGYFLLQGGGFFDNQIGEYAKM